ncbi:multiple cyclophane-containing RiPP AmcA [Amycolatopsis dongchuanensis]
MRRLLSQWKPIRLAKFDNRPTWDNSPEFDNRPGWDNWNKR